MSVRSHKRALNSLTVQLAYAETDSNTFRISETITFFDRYTFKEEDDGQTY